VDLDSAVGTWRKLINDGWELMEQQINEDAA